MKNLKRALALALSSIMLVGTMAMGVSAAEFGDADKIEHNEAVQTMVALGVINGKDNGNFDPEGIVTRAEMAKIICVMLNNGKDPNLGTTAAAFPDTVNHWANSYIAYCANQGIVAGDNHGKFNPEATVTGTEAAKMMLVALGYDSDVFNFTGASWAINVNAQANKAKLYDDVDSVATDGLSRDNAAQMAYNTLSAFLMEKTYDKVLSSGEISYNYVLSNTTTFLNEYFDAKIFIGTYVGNDKTISALDKDSIRVNGRLDTDDGTTSGQTDRNANFPSDMDISNIGEEVKVIFKDGKSGKDGQPDKNDTIYGVFNTGATEVITGTLADVKDNKSDKAQINIGGDKYDLKTSETASDEVVHVITNYVGSGTGYKTAQVKGTSSSNSALTTALKVATGDTIKAVTDPEDGKIQTIYVTTSKIAAVTGKNSEKVTMNNGVGTIKIADNEVYEDIAKGDVVVVTTLYAARATDDEAYTIVEKAEKVTGEVEGYKDAKTVKVDGETYKVYNEAAMLSAIPDETPVTAFADEHIGETFDLYMVNGFVGAAIQVSESASNYSLVIAKNEGEPGTTFDGMEIQVLDAEGNKTILKVNDDSKDVDDGALANADLVVGDIVTWTGTANDATVTVEAKAASGSKSYNDETKAFDGKVAASGAVLFAETTSNAYSAASGTKFKAYNLRELDAFTASAYAVKLNSDGKVVALFADLTTTPSGATDSTVYGIVTAYNGTVKVDGDTYFEYTVAANEETYTVHVASKAVKAGDLVAFDPSSDDIYDARDLNKVTEGAVYVKEYSEADGTLTYYTNKTGEAGEWAGDVATQNTLALDKDCAIVYVNADDDKAGSDIGINGFDTVTGYANAAIVTKRSGSDNVIVAIFVETSNECNILDVVTEEGKKVISGGTATVTTGEEAVVRGGDVTMDGGKADVYGGKVAMSGGEVKAKGGEFTVTGSTAKIKIGKEIGTGIKITAGGKTLTLANNSTEVVKAVENGEFVSGLSSANDGESWTYHDGELSGTWTKN